MATKKAKHALFGNMSAFVTNYMGNSVCCGAGFMPF